MASSYMQNTCFKIAMTGLYKKKIKNISQLDLLHQQISKNWKKKS